MRATLLPFSSIFNRRKMLGEKDTLVLFLLFSFMFLLFHYWSRCIAAGVASRLWAGRSYPPPLPKRADQFRGPPSPQISHILAVIDFRTESSHHLIICETTVGLLLNHRYQKTGVNLWTWLGIMQFVLLKVKRFWELNDITKFQYLLIQKYILCN